MPDTEAVLDASPLILRQLIAVGMYLSERTVAALLRQAEE